MKQVELTNAAISYSNKATLVTKKLVPDFEMTVELETGPPITQGGDALWLFVNLPKTEVAEAR
eukprot:6526588-Prymnesium_polylepis.1